MSRQVGAEDQLVGQAPFVVYGVMTNWSPRYMAKLAAQVETWAAGLAEQGRLFAVAGRRGPGHHQHTATDLSMVTAASGAGLVVDERCGDDRASLACKEARILEEGFDRGATWLMVLGEDNYVNTERAEEALREYEASPQPSGPVVLGWLGCGGQRGFCPELDDPPGGLCGGGGYALNRAALELLMKDGKEALRREFPTGPVPVAGMPGVSMAWPGDVATSCAARRRGIRLGRLPYLGTPNGLLKESDFVLELSRNPSTMHYCTPSLMRWVHAVVTLNNSMSELQEFHDAAFKKGCRGEEIPPWILKRCQQQVKAEVAAHPAK